MCGLAGIFDPDGGPVDEAMLRRMTGALRHRGPDGDGFHFAPGIGLGHRRLAIIDPDGGQQPMYNEDGSVATVFNGMIYNFQDLQRTLQAMGHRFRTRCDTETIVHAWESYGADCLTHLDGMFAVAVWDAERRTLLLARDRLGKKPLYYTTDPVGRVLFASEPAALAAAGLRRTLDPASVEDFFAFGYVPDPATIWREVRRLPAGHFLLLESGRAGRTTPSPLPQPRRYWQVPATIQPVGEAEAGERLLGLLSTATERRLVSDVPLGAFLSGGVDSSAVVAIAARLRGAPLDTFTIGFDGAEDETGYAAQVAARYGTRQHATRAAAVDMIDAARTVARVFGEPFGDSSAVPTLTVCELARRHAAVALSGDGGDEVFAGYRRYRWHVLVESVRRHLPPALRRGAVGTFARLYPKLDRAPRWLRAKHTLTELSLDAAQGFAVMVAKQLDTSRRALFAPSLLAALDGYDPAARFTALLDACGSDDPLLQAQYMDLHTWLPGDILPKVDRASMAHSLEVRAPFLDTALLSFGVTLPAALKLADGQGKRLLKRVLEPLLPADILYRPKQGFAASQAAYFRAHSTRLRARLLQGALQDCGLFAGGAIDRLVDQHVSGAFDHSVPLWLLLVFEGFLAGEANETRHHEPARLAAG